MTFHAISAGGDSGGNSTLDQRLRVLFGACWLAILLGLGLQILVLVAKTAAGADVPGAQVLVDIAGGVTWSLIVCGGVAVGSVAARSASGAMGLLGLVCAPLAFAAAKGVQRGAAWLNGQPMEKMSALVVQTGALKTIEYAMLGYLLGAIIRTPASTLRNHASLGLLFGLTFGWLILALNLVHANGAQIPAPKAVGVMMNEMIFPLGCSLVIYFVATLSDRGAAMERVVAGGG
jgi:hypothetical protein